MQKARSVLFSPVHLSLFSPEFQEFLFFTRCTVMMAWASCFRLMSIMWTFNKRLKALQPRRELVTHPCQWKQPGLLGLRATDWALASGSAEWTDMRNCCLWCEKLLDVTDNDDRSWQELLIAPWGMAGFHRWFRGNDVRDGQTSLKGNFRVLGKTNSALVTTSMIGYKTEITSVRNRPEILIGYVCRKTGTNNEKVIV